MKLFKTISLLLLIIIVVILAIQNSEIVTITFLKWNILLFANTTLIASFILGVLTGSILFLKTKNIKIDEVQNENNVKESTSNLKT